MPGTGESRTRRGAVASVERWFPALFVAFFLLLGLVMGEWGLVTLMLLAAPFALGLFARRVEVRDDEVVEHVYLWFRRSWPGAAIAAVVLRRESVGWIGIPTSAPTLRFTDGSERDLLGLTSYDDVRGEADARWLAEQIGVPYEDALDAPPPPMPWGLPPEMLRDREQG